jgi:hypothetical protein
MKNIFKLDHSKDFAVFTVKNGTYSATTYSSKNDYYQDVGTLGTTRADAMEWERLFDYCEVVQTESDLNDVYLHTKNRSAVDLALGAAGFSVFPS